MTRWSEGLKVSEFHLNWMENEQQPNKLLELLTMSTCSRQPPRHRLRPFQIEKCISACVSEICISACVSECACILTFTLPFRTISRTNRTLPSSLRQLHPTSRSLQGIALRVRNTDRRHTAPLREAAERPAAASERRPGPTGRAHAFEQ